MSREQSVMRTNLLPGLVDTLRNNRTRQLNRIRLFELGLVFQQEDTRLRQPERLAGLLWGRRHDEGWQSGTEGVDFFDAKGVVDALVEWRGQTDVGYAPSASKVLHPGLSAAVTISGRNAGYIGRLHPEIEARLEIEGVYVFELDAEIVLERPRRKYTAVSRFPSVRRDLAVVVDRKIPAAEIERCVRQVLDKTFVEFRLFDVYEGKSIDSNEKSLAIGLTFQSQTATLTDDEVNAYATAVMVGLTEEFDARLR